MNHPVVYNTNLQGLGPRYQGKVRDVYDLGDCLLIVASDRLSAFDVVMEEPVPKKGMVLTLLSIFWFKMFEGTCRNHFITADVDEYPAICQPYKEILLGRSMLVKKCRPLKVEAIVRGYISGSGWKEYQKTGAICGIELPPGLVESEKFSDPIFTPSSKAELGEHDENITFERAADTIGRDLAVFVREIALKIYRQAHEFALPRGVILADTKFEFGVDEDGEIILIDEILTPDSSRFWDPVLYQPGKSQTSFDKQPVRDYLDTLDPKWNKKPPPPKLPGWVLSDTTSRYQQALRRLTGYSIP